jgi:diaminopimelate decarboxylase
MRKPPFSLEEIEELAREHPTPFHVYDKEGIERTADEMTEDFSAFPGYRNHFAIKATPYWRLLEMLRKKGMGMDASSMPELMLAEMAGSKGEEIFMTSNNTPAEEFQKARDMGAIINFDDISHIPYYLREVGSLPETVAMRYNPGPLKKGTNKIFADPPEQKYGAKLDQLIESYRLLKENGAKKFGLHTMVASNGLDPDYFAETARILFKAALEVRRKTGVTMDIINLGGGFGIPYEPEQQKLDLKRVAEGIRQEYEKVLLAGGHPETRIVTESGRYVTGPHGYLVTRVRHLKDTYKKYAGVDATMANLMRPGMYGSYHHMAVLGRENEALTELYDVTGSLCENNDKFAIDRPLPPLRIGDLIVIFEAGAHGSAMGFRYNGKLHAAEFMRHGEGDFQMIRRAETPADYFATQNF